MKVIVREVTLIGLISTVEGPTNSITINYKKIKKFKINSLAKEEVISLQENPEENACKPYSYFLCYYFLRRPHHGVKFHNSDKSK